MCVALPGKVVAMDETAGTAEVDFSGNRVTAMSGLIQVEKGDYVLVHAGCILQKMQKDEAEELAQLFSELNG
jgi:hydrogenase expression/formation protein HypC